MGLMDEPDEEDALYVQHEDFNDQRCRLKGVVQFSNKDVCIVFIKQYSLKVLVDYKVTISNLTLYIGKCWDADEGWPLCKCINSLVEAKLTIHVVVLVVELQARYGYNVSYWKAWDGQQLAMREQHGYWDDSYNGLWLYRRKFCREAGRGLTPNKNVQFN
ncbi:hypothetical protein J1N35_040023 [Gossypium stocksii]|uniref:Uncharacterized protein n=1 Tax=Gossypium stocksii TaxID=47602 RepID=A0A9D3UCW4_9ROSI|nr:hypothetical protein J1N35_040023 [Gossypium stocksii]